MDISGRLRIYHAIGYYILYCCVGTCISSGGACDVDESWHYPETTWCKNYPLCCEGNRQSPIDVRPTGLTRYQTIRLINYNFRPRNILLCNDGRTLKAELQFDPRRKPVIQFPTLTGSTGTFVLDYLHFHWSQREDDREGSEHAINGKHYPLEMHMVHYNSNYNSTDVAKKHPDGLLIFSILYNVNKNCDNQPLNDVMRNLPHVITAPSQTMARDTGRLTPYMLLPRAHQSLFEPIFTGEVMAYEGSLTAPGCQQSVKWIVFKRQQIISEYQLDLVRLLRKENGEGYVGENYRKLQNTNSRAVTRFETQFVST